MSKTIGQVTGTGQCDPNNPDRKRFYTEGVALHVPNWLEDKKLRWLIDQGQDLYTAHRDAELLDILPEQGMRDCVYDVLRTKYYDAASRQWKTTGGNITCTGYWDCFVNYVEALRQYRKRGRIKIAEGVIAPSPEEAACIKQRFGLHKDLARAYAECKASDILPTWGLANISSILLDNPKAHLYDVLKTVYRMTQPEQPEQPERVLPPDEQVPTPKKDNALLYIVGGVAAVVILSRR